MTRRRLVLEIFGVTLLTSAISWSVPLFAEGAAQPEPEYRLRLYHTHTNEGIDVVYRQGDHYLPSAVARLNSFLRDRRTGTVFQLDRRVFDLLHHLTVAVGRPEAQIDIICGYRTPWSNEFLRRTTSGVASNSLHMLGEPNLTILRTRAELLQLKNLQFQLLAVHANSFEYTSERFGLVGAG